VVCSGYGPSSPQVYLGIWFIPISPTSEEGPRSRVHWNRAMLLDENYKLVLPLNLLKPILCRLHFEIGFISAFIKLLYQVTRVFHSSQFCLNLPYLAKQNIDLVTLQVTKNRGWNWVGGRTNTTKLKDETGCETREDFMDNFNKVIC